MESELEKFRRRKQMEETREEIKNRVKGTVNSWTQSFYQALLPNWNDEEEEDVKQDDCDVPERRKTVSQRNQNQHKESVCEDQEKNAVNGRKQKWLVYLGKFFRLLAWLLTYVGFLKIGFGAVYFTISLLVFIYWNTRQTTKKERQRKGEVSAYSVFNKDCQSIDGTLKAEHLEKQLLYKS